MVTVIAYTRDGNRIDLALTENDLFNLVWALNESTYIESIEVYQGGEEKDKRDFGWKNIDKWEDIIYENIKKG